MGDLLQIVSDLPVLTIVFVAFIAILAIVFHVNYNERTVAVGPTILTTTGIFATFVGIAYGLSKFQTTDIQASVPELLYGLKTAFWASVCGVGFALTLKLRHYVFDFKPVDSAGSPAYGTIEDLIRELRSIQNSLAGDDDSTLISQIKLLRHDSNDKLDALRKAQVESLEKLSKLGSEALIEALRSVIQDFNVKITEQFGDNFKYLNEAVGRLLTWQQQYKSHVEATAARHDEIVQGMKEATENFSLLSGEASSFSKTASDLSSLMSVLESQKQTQQKLLESLGTLLTAASGALPEIQTKIVEIARQLSVAATQSASDETIRRNHREDKRAGSHARRRLDRRATKIARRPWSSTVGAV
jgi:hypothetical protein